MRNFLLIPFLFLLACNGADNNHKIQAISETGIADEQITCWGIGEIQLDLDEKALISLIGRENVQIDSLYNDGKFKRMVSRLWRGQNKELTIYWREIASPFTAIDSLELSGVSSIYKFSNGIALGVRLSELVKQNGNVPVNLGFTHSGQLQVLNFGKGKLKGDMPCFSGKMTFPDSIPASKVGELKALKYFDSSNEILKAYNPILTVIRIKNI